MAKKRKLATTFHTYILGAALGEGGAGRVFEAHDAEGRVVAVKILNPVRATSERRRRFKNEIRFGERTQHPNIVPVLDHGVMTGDDGEAPFYVMPRYRSSLRDLMGTLGDAEARLRYFDELLSGVDAAHRVRVIHRDLKPENILFDETRDCLVVGDWGIAHFVDEELYTAVETQEAARLANFVYAAPEQRARGAMVDGRADLYALGLMLNELFTGAVPHGTGYQRIAAVNADLGWLDGVVDVLLRQTPDERPESVDAVKRAFVSHRQNYVVLQRLDEVQNTVVPGSSVTDPLADEPPKIVDFEWARNQLTLILDRPVNDRWVQALKSMGSYASVMGKGPEYFRFTENKAIVSAGEHEAQRVIDHFKDWLPKATTRYRQMLERAAADSEAKERGRLQAEQEELERQKRLRASIRL